MSTNPMIPADAETPSGATAVEAMQATMILLEAVRSEVREILSSATGRNPGLYGVRGAVSRACRDELERGIHHDYIRYGLSRSYGSALEKRIAQVVAMLRTPDTPSMKEQAEALRTRLEGTSRMIEASYEALKVAEAREKKAAEDRWPMSNRIIEEVQEWGRCVTQTLQLWENLAGSTEPSEPIDKLTADDLVDDLQEIAKVRPDLAEELESAIGRLDERDWQGCWMILYRISARFIDGTLVREEK